jgi:guanylate kinase
VEEKKMKFICIMGKKNAGKSTVEAYLEKIGFKRSISYTTREPEVRNGRLEEDKVDYNFVTERKFMDLVHQGKIIEYERYGKNLYGTPVPYGSQRFVAVVCLGGYRALKEIFGEQIVGVYLQCDRDTAIERAKIREDIANIEKTISRIERDELLTEDMIKEADIVINGNQDIANVLADILKAVKHVG